jgi:Tfp pilus assembly protein PilO
VKKLLEKQQIVILVLVLTAIVCFVFFRYLPLTKKARQIENEKQQQMVLLDQLKDRNSQIAELKEKLFELRDFTADYDARIPDSRMFAVMWQQVADIMNHYGLTDQLVQPGKEIKGPNLTCIPINIQCKGTMQSIFDFLESVDKLDRLMQIEQLALENDNDFSGNLKMDAQAYVYYMSNGEGN